ncbi:MAG: ECF transporter S component [Clostridia bacterium]|nr:ECF transporter S component [Clostridia bacterium]
MKASNKRAMSTKTMVLMAMLTALVVILTYAGSFIRLSPMVTVSLTLVPIVLGAVLCGVWGGSWLGLVNAIVILASGQAAFFFGISPAGTVVVVLAKGTLCGLAAALLYRLISRRNKYVAVVTAAVICPVVNTGIYLIGCLTVFFSAIEGMIGEAMPSVMSVLIYGMGLVNFPFELLFNIVLCPVIYRLIKLLPKFAHD